MEWTEEVKEAVSRLRQALCAEPLLITPDFNLPFVVQTDASEVGLGAVLSQVRSGEEHPVTFIRDIHADLNDGLTDGDPSPFCPIVEET